MTFLCPMLLMLNALSQNIPIGARFVYPMNNLDALDRQRLFATLHLCRTPFKVIKVYPDFMRLEKIRNHPMEGE